MEELIAPDSNALMSYQKIINILEKLIKTSNMPKLFDGGINKITELSEGNVNQVFRIRLRNDFSFIVKYAPPFAYRYQDIAIVADRNGFEADVLLKFSKVKKDYYPDIYHYDNLYHLMLMEDLKDYSVMRDALIKGEIFDYFSSQVNDLMMGLLDNIPKDKSPDGINISYEDGISELQEITRFFVFQNPFGLHYPKGFLCLKENHKWVKEHIFENQTVQEIRKKLELSYYTKKEALIHGDLHTGSIMLNDKKLKVIDPEFARIGPITFDVAMLLANLIMSIVASCYYLKDQKSQRHEFQKWLFDSINDIYQNSIHAYTKAGFNELIIREEITGFCAIEIIRRIIGEAQIKDFLMIDCLSTRSILERNALEIAVFQLQSLAKSNVFKDSLMRLKDLIINQDNTTKSDSSNFNKKMEMS